MIPPHPAELKDRKPKGWQTASFLAEWGLVCKTMNVALNFRCILPIQGITRTISTERTTTGKYVGLLWNNHLKTMGYLAVPWQQAYRTSIFKTHMEVQSTEGELVLGFISRLSVDTYTAISGLSISADDWAVHESSPCGRRAPPNVFNFLSSLNWIERPHPHWSNVNPSTSCDAEVLFLTLAGCARDSPRPKV